MSSARNHFLYSLRRLASAPGYALLFCSTLGLGLGILGTALGAVQAATDSQPTVRPQGTLAFLRAVNGGKALPHTGLDADWMRRAETVPSQLLDRKSSYIFAMTSVELGGRSLPVKAEVISGAYFEILGVEALAGRLLDRTRNAGAQFVVSERFWRTHLGADAGVIGKAFRVGAGSLVLVGVVPREFNGLHGGHMLGNDIWLDREGAAAINAGDLSAHVFGVIAEGHTVAQADQASRATYGFAIVPFETAFSQSPSGVAASGVIMLVLATVVVVACYSNVGGMFLTRLRERESELHIRSMLGARSHQLLILLVCEIAVLMVLAVAIGYVVARMLSAALGNFEWSVGRGLNLRVVPAVDWSVVGLVAGGAVLCALGLSLAASRALRSGAAFESLSRRRIVGAQCAVAVFLMALTTPLMLELRTVNERYSREELSSVTTGWLDHRVLGTQPGDANGTTRRLLDELRADPVVSAVSAGSDIPVGRRGRRVRIVRTDGSGCSVSVFAVTDGFLATLGYQMAVGRSDSGLVVDESVVRRCGSGQAQIGEAVSVVAGDQSSQLTVTGIARPPEWLNDGELRAFLPLAEDQTRVVILLSVRPGTTPGYLKAGSLLYDVRPLKAEILENTASLVASASLGGLLSFAALMTSAIGLFGIVSLQAARRRREFATRLALGARAGHIYRLVVGEYATTLVVSCVIGGVGAVLMGRYLASSVVGVPGARGAVSLLVAVCAATGVVGVAAAAVWRTLRKLSYQTLRDA